MGLDCCARGRGGRGHCENTNAFLKPSPPPIGSFPAAPTGPRGKEAKSSGHADEGGAAPANRLCWVPVSGPVTLLQRRRQGKPFLPPGAIQTCLRWPLPAAYLHRSNQQGLRSHSPQMNSSPAPSQLPVPAPSRHEARQGYCKIGLLLNGTIKQISRSSAQDSPKGPHFTE